MSDGSKPTGLVGKISWALFKAPIALLSAEYKAVGALLVALLVAVAIGQIGNKIFEVEPLEKNAYPIHVEGAAVPGDGETAGETQTGPAPIGPLLASADVVAGEQVAARRAVRPASGNTRQRCARAAGAITRASTETWLSNADCRALVAVTKTTPVAE